MARPRAPHGVRPVVGPELLVSYSVRQPLATHWRPQTCQEASCVRWREGWQLDAKVVTPQHLADLKSGGWHWTVLDVSATEQYLVFPAGQRCLNWQSHRTRAYDRPSLYLVRPGRVGEWRGTPRVHTRADDWKDDFQHHLSQVADDRQKG